VFIMPESAFMMTGIGVQHRSESVFTFDRNRCSRWAGIRTSAALVAFGSGWKALKRRNIAVELLGIRRLANETWLRVRLTELDDFGLEVQQGHLKPVVGWIPAYRLSGETSLWYYARD